MRTRFGYLSRSEVVDLGLAEVGKDVMIHEFANIVGAQHIRLGSHVRIDGFINLIAQAPVSIGDYVHVGSFCHISASDEIWLGNFCGLSQGVYLYTASDDYSGATLTNPTVDPDLARHRKGPVRLSDHVILGANTVVLPGVTVGEGTAVGALSLVNADLAEWGIYGGVPARRIGPRSRALLALVGQMRDPP